MIMGVVCFGKIPMTTQDTLSEKQKQNRAELIELLGKANYSRGAGEIANDSWQSVKSGLVGAAQAGMGITNLMRGGHTGKAFQEHVWDMQKTQENIAAKKSDTAKMQQGQFERAEGFGGKLGAIWDNPMLAVDGVAQSVPQVFAVGAIGRGVGALGVKNTALKAGIGESVVGAGSAAENMRSENEDGLLTGKEIAGSLAIGGTTGLLGYGGAKLAQKLGIEDADTLAVGGLKTLTQAGETSAGGIGNGLKGIGKGAVAEGVLEELPQTIAETALDNWANDRALGENMAGNAAMGLASGALMGGTVGAASSKWTKDTPPTDNQTPPTKTVIGEDITPNAPAGNGGNRMGVKVDENGNEITPESLAVQNQMLYDNSAPQATSDSTENRLLENQGTPVLDKNIALEDGTILRAGDPNAYNYWLTYEREQARAKRDKNTQQGFNDITPIPTEAVAYGLASHLNNHQGVSTPLLEFSQSIVDKMADNGVDVHALMDSQDKQAALTDVLKSTDPKIFANSQNFDNWLNQNAYINQFKAVETNTIPMPSPQKPSERLGLNPNQGALSKSAVVAVDSGASPAGQMLQQNAHQRLQQSSATSTEDLSAYQAQKAEQQAQQSQYEAAAKQIFASAPKLMGKQNYIQNQGERLATQIMVVEADSLMPSASNAINQARDRNRAVSQDQVRAIADNLDPAQLADSTTMGHGSPTISEDGTIIAGNGRTMALKQAYAQGKGEEYRQMLMDKADEYGLDKTALSGMKNPVLVKSVGNITPDKLRKLALNSNETGTMAQSAFENAKADVERVASLNLNRLQVNENTGDINTPANRAIINDFVSKFPIEQQNALRTADGMLSKQGLERFENALLLSAYGDNPTTQSILESTDTELRNAVKAMVATAPSIAKTKQSIKDGITPNDDIASDISEALALLARLRREGVKPSDYLAQQNLFGDVLSDTGKRLLAFMDKNIKSVVKIRSLLYKYYANLAQENLQQDDMFGKPVQTKQSRLNDTFKELGYDEFIQSSTDDTRPTNTEPSTNQSATSQTRPARQTGQVHERPEKSSGDEQGVGRADGGVSLTGQEFGDINTTTKQGQKDFVQAVKKFLNSLKGKTVFNKSLNANITINATGINKTIRFNGMNVSAVKMQAMAKLPELLKNAKLVSSDASYDKGGKIGNLVYYYMVAPFSVNGTEYGARIVVRKDSENNYYYDFQAKNSIDEILDEFDIEKPLRGQLFNIRDHSNGLNSSLSNDNATVNDKNGVMPDENWEKVQEIGREKLKQSRHKQLNDIKQELIGEAKSLTQEKFVEHYIRLANDLTDYIQSLKPNALNKRSAEINRLQDVFGIIGAYDSKQQNEQIVKEALQKFWENAQEQKTIQDKENPDIGASGDLARAVSEFDSSLTKSGGDVNATKAQQSNEISQQSPSVQSNGTQTGVWQRVDKKQPKLTPKDKAKQVLQGEAVAHIDESKLNMPMSGGYKAVTTWAMGLFNQWGNVATSPILGDVVLNEQSIKDSISHDKKLNPYKNLALASIKDVLEKGVLIHADYNTKGEDSFYVAAPVMLNDNKNIVTVLVHRDVNTQRMYLHYVGLVEKLMQSHQNMTVAQDKTSRKHNRSATASDIASIIQGLLDVKTSPQTTEQALDNEQIYHDNLTPSQQAMLKAIAKLPKDDPKKAQFLDEVQQVDISDTPTAKKQRSELTSRITAYEMVRRKAHELADELKNLGYVVKVADNTVFDNTKEIATQLTAKKHNKTVNIVANKTIQQGRSNDTTRDGFFVKDGNDSYKLDFHEPNLGQRVDTHANYVSNRDYFTDKRPVYEQEPKPTDWQQKMAGQLARLYDDDPALAGFIEKANQRNLNQNHKNSLLQSIKRYASLQEKRGNALAEHDVMTRQNDVYHQGKIRFSRMANNHNTDPKNLFIAHNISANGVLHANKLGGLPAPSIAIARADISDFSNYGEITLLADKSLLDESMPAFNADVYSPRQPKAEHKINYKAFNDFINQLDTVNGYLQTPNFASSSGAYGMEDFVKSSAMQYHYLKSIGKAPKIKDKKVSVFVKRFAKLNLNSAALVKNPSFIRYVQEQVKKQHEQKLVDANAMNIKFFEKAHFNADGSIQEEIFNHYAHEVEQYRLRDGKDYGALKDDITKVMRHAKIAQAYQAWAIAQFDRLVEAKQFVAGQTKSGNVKYQEYTLDNLVTKMTQTIRNGEGFNYASVGSVRSQYAKELKDLKDIQDNRDSIVSPADFAPIKEQAEKVLADALTRLKPFYKYDSNSWNYEHDAASSLAQGTKGIKDAFKLTVQSKKIIDELTEYLANLPTEYFEVKAQRAVQFGEFKTAIVPKNVDKTVKQILKDAGLVIKTYDPDISGDRQRVIAGQEKLLFSQANVIAPLHKQAKVLQGEPVAHVNWQEVNYPIDGDKHDVFAWAKQMLDKQGRTANNPTLGEIEIGNKYIRDTWQHGGGNPPKNLAYAIIKDVLEKGVVIAQDDDGKEEDSFFISAPVTITGRASGTVENIVTATVHKKRGSQKIYVHAISTTQKLMHPRVSSATDNSVGIARSLSALKPQTRSSRHAEQLNSVDIHNILQKALTYKGQSDSRQGWHYDGGFGERVGLFDLPPIPITTIHAKNLGFKDTKKLADEILRQLQSTDNLINDDTGWVLSVGKKDRKKMGNNNELTHATSQAVQGLDELVKHAIVAETHTDNRHNNPDVKAVHRLYAPAMIDGQLYRVKLTVKDYQFTTGQEGKKALHAIEAVEIENALLGTVPSYSTSNDVQTAQPTTGHSISVADLLDGVKRDGDKLPFGTNVRPSKHSSRFGTTFDEVIDALNHRFGKDTITKLHANNSLKVLSLAQARQQFGSIPDNADGFYVNDTAYLIHDNIHPEMIVPTFLHELGGHGGLQTLMSDGAYQGFMNEFDKLVKNGDKLAQQAKALADKNSNSKDEAQNEYLPYLITLASHQSQNQGKIKGLINRMMMAIRTFIREKLGVSLPVTADEIVLVAQKAVRERANGRVVSNNQNIWFSYNDDKQTRLEKLKNSSPIEITGKEIGLSDDIKQLKRNAFEYGKKLRGRYTNQDTGREIEVNRPSLVEILKHDYKNVEHLQSIAAVPQIIEKSIYIETLPNEDKAKNPHIKEYEYYLTGLKINGVDYTVKAVIGVSDMGDKYYDHKLTSIEKGDLLEARHTVIKSGVPQQKSPLDIDDKRLLQILQEKNDTTLDNVGMFDPSNDDIRFSLNESDDSDFATAIDDFLAGRDIKESITLGTTPDVLRMLGMPDVSVKIKDYRFGKILKGKHAITPKRLKQLPKQLNNPVAVLRSSENSTNPDGYVVLTELTEFNREKQASEPVIVALHIDKSGAVELIEVASAYGKNHKGLQTMLNEDKILYWHKEKGQHLVSVHGLQLPLRLRSDAVLSLANIKTNDDLSQYQQQNKLEQSDNTLDNLDIQFSRMAEFYENNADKAKETVESLQKTANEFIANPKSFVKKGASNKKADHLGKFLQFFGQEQIVKMYGEKLQGLKDYHRMVVQMDADSNEQKDRYDRLAVKWKRVKDDKALAELMHEVTLTGIDPTAPIKGAKNTKNIQLKAKYDKLSDEAKAVFNAAKDDYQAHYENLHRAMVDRIQRNDKLSDERKNKLIAKLNKELLASKKVFFPLTRFGDYVVVVRDTDSNVVNVARAETKGQADEIRRQLIKDNPNHKVGAVTLGREFDIREQSGIKGLASEFLADDLDLDDDLQKDFINALLDRQLATNNVMIKNTQGFSQNARRAYAYHMSRGANHIAKLRHTDRLKAKLDEMQAYIDSQDGDVIELQRVMDEMNKRHALLLNPPSNPVSTMATAVGFMWYMGLSPASALVNLSQTLLIAAPMMGAKWGYQKTSNELLRASKDWWKIASWRNEDGTISWDSFMHSDHMRNAKKVLSDDELEAMKKAFNSGAIDKTQAHDLSGVASGDDEKMMNTFKPMMKVASVMFHEAEVLNRQATFLASYRLARQKGADHDMAYEQAYKMTFEAHFNYAGYNRPRFMIGNVAKVLFLFKQYAQNMVFLLTHNTLQSFKGETPEKRAEARKILMGIMGGHAVMAGALGLPWAITAPFLVAFSALGGDDDDELTDNETEFRNALANLVGDDLAEVLAKGLPRAVGVDLSSRVGLDSLILPRTQDGLEGEDKFKDLATALLGPVFGIGAGAYNGVSLWQEEHRLRGAEAMSPKFFGDYLKAIRYATEGHTTKDGKEIVERENVGMWDSGLQAIGFRSAKFAQTQEARSVIFDAERKLQAMRKDLVDSYARAYREGDNERADKIWERIVQFNAKNPSVKITRPALMKSIRERNRRIENAKDGIYLSKNREHLRDYGAFGLD